MPLDPLDVPATSNHLYTLAQKHYLSADALNYALRLIGIIPDKKAWQRFLDLSLLLLGTALLLAGIIFFFAYNWADMHRFVKFGILEGSILAIAVFITWRSLNSLIGKVALLAVSVLLGALLAVYGQTYQTGADVFSLFLTWAVLITPWVILGNFAPLWSLLILLLNLSLILFWIQIVEYPNVQLFLLLYGLNGIFLIIWEVAFKIKVSWLQNPWLGRLLFCVILAILVLVTEEAIIESDFQGWSRSAIIVYLATTVAALSYYTVKRRDLFLLIVNFLGIVTVFTTFIGSFMQFWDAINWLTLAILVVIQLSIVTHLSLKISKSWEQSA